MKERKNAYLLHLRTMTIMIAPKRAEIIDTTIKVKVHPSSPAASGMRKFKQIPIKYRVVDVFHI